MVSRKKRRPLPAAGFLAGAAGLAGGAGAFGGVAAGVLLTLDVSDMMVRLTPDPLEWERRLLTHAELFSHY